MPSCASTGPVLGRCCQHRPSTCPILATNGMFIGILTALVVMIRCMIFACPWMLDTRIVTIVQYTSSRSHVSRIYSLRHCFKRLRGVMSHSEITFLILLMGPRCLTSLWRRLYVPYWCRASIIPVGALAARRLAWPTQVWYWSNVPRCYASSTVYACILMFISRSVQRDINYVIF